MRQPRPVRHWRRPFGDCVRFYATGAQYMAEVTTAVKHDMNITDAHAENCGALGICVSERAGLDEAIGRAVMTDPDLV
jgi:hypothetical protein